MAQQHTREAESLSTLLRFELAAALAYQHAVRSLDGRLAGESEQIRELAAGHQRNISALRSTLRALGGATAVEPTAPWSPFALLRDELSVQQLLEAEECGLADYEAVLPSLAGEVRDVVAHELIPRQRRHVATLSKHLLDLCAV